MNIQDEKSVNWTRFWSTGAINSCAGSFQGNYGGAIAVWWLELFKQLLPDSQVLDLCTGNGAIPQLINSNIADEQKLPFVLGVDLAKISPDWVNQLSPSRAKKIKCLGGINADALPLEGASIDFIVSQFGFEYCYFKNTLAELNRVTRKKAIVAFVLHHVESVISRVSNEESIHCQFLLEANGLVETAKNLFPYLAQLKNQQDIQQLFADPRIDQVRISYQSALEATHARVATARVPDILLETLQQVADIGRAVQTRGLEKAIERLAELENNLVAAIVRFRGQISHAYAIKDIDLLQQELQGFGFEVSVAEISEPAHGVMAWGLLATRKP